MADAAGVGGGINAGTPIGFAGAAACGDVLVFAESQGGGFLNANDVVLEAEVGIDVFFGLEVAGNDAGTVGKGEHATVSGEVVSQAVEEFAPEIFKMLHVCFAHLAEEEAFQFGNALAIIRAHLRQEPVGLAAATSAAEPDGGGAARPIAAAGGGEARIGHACPLQSASILCVIMITRRKIREVHDGEATPPFFVIHRGDYVAALALYRCLNPRVTSEPRGEVWVAKGPIREVWGRRLANRRGRLAVYVRENAAVDAYKFMGAYRVDGSTQDPEIRAAAERSTKSVGRLSRIVYLRKAS